MLTWPDASLAVVCWNDCCCWDWDWDWDCCCCCCCLEASRWEPFTVSLMSSKTATHKMQTMYVFVIVILAAASSVASYTLTHPHRECSDAVLLCFLSEGTSYKLVVFFLSFFGIQRAHSFRSSSCNRYRFLFPVKNTLLHSMYGMLHWRRSCLTSGLPIRGKVFSVLPGDPSVFFLCLLSLLLFFCSCASSFFLG